MRPDDFPPPETCEGGDRVTDTVLNVSFKQSQADHQTARPFCVASYQFDACGHPVEEAGSHKLLSQILVPQAYNAKTRQTRQTAVSVFQYLLAV
jgi:hypothetical protein